MTSNSPADPADAIAAALARLRGRRMPRPPWEGGPQGMGPQGMGPQGFGGHRAHGEPPWMHGGPHHGHAHGGPPPWLAGGRIGGPARLRLLDALAAASLITDS